MSSCRRRPESTPTGTHACMDAGGRAASGTSGRGGRAAPACRRQVGNRRPRRGVVGMLSKRRLSPVGTERARNSRRNAHCHHSISFNNPMAASIRPVLTTKGYHLDSPRILVVSARVFSSSSRFLIISDRTFSRKRSSSLFAESGFIACRSIVWLLAASLADSERVV